MPTHVIIGGKKFILQLVPCGVLRPDCRAVIGNASYRPMAFLKEVGKLRDLGVEIDRQLFVSNRARSSALSPHDRARRRKRPGARRSAPPAAHRPAYEDKMARNGLRVVDLLNSICSRRISQMPSREEHHRARTLRHRAARSAQMYEEYARAAEQIRAFVTIRRATEQSHPQRRKRDVRRAHKAPCLTSITAPIRSSLRPRNIRGAVTGTGGRPPPSARSSA